MKGNQRLSISEEDSFLNTDESIDPSIYKNIMTQKINKRLDMVLSKEINKRKKIIYDLFQTKFGPNFIAKKPESLNHFELLLGKYYFSKKSKFLQKCFPSLYNKIFHNKKIDLDKLKTKINMGPMMYLSLRKHLVSNKSLISDKLLYISKNFTTKTEKDLVSNLYFKIKKNANNSKNKLYKSNSKKLYSSTKSLNFGNISRVNSSKSQLKIKIKDVNNNTDNNERKEDKKVFFTIDIGNRKNQNHYHNIFDYNNNKIFSKTHNNFFGRNKEIIKLKNGLNKNKKKNSNSKISSKNINNFLSSEFNDKDFKKFYLSNPFYIYNSNIHKRNKNKYEISQSGNQSITKENFINPQLLIKSKNSNMILPNSTFDANKNKSPKYFVSDNISFSPRNRTISSFKNLKDSDINNTLTNNMIIDEKENTINIKEKEKVNNILTIPKTAKIRIHKKNFISMNRKNSFKKYLIKKSKKFKNRINSEAKILNNCTNKCNEKLIKLIDKNFILNSKDKKNNQTKNANFDMTKLLLDDKIPKKVFIKYAKNLDTIKPIFKKTVNDLTKFDKRDKNLGKKYFIKNINNMPTNLALYFIGQLYETKHIKFGLKEFEQKREEEKMIKEEQKLKQLRIKSKNNLFKMKQLEYVLLNEKDAFFHKENEKIKNKKIFKKINDKKTMLKPDCESLFEKSNCSKIVK